MEGHDYPVLCGGTFFTLLLRARKQRTNARAHFKNEYDHLSDHDVLAGLIKVISREYIIPLQSSMVSITSKYKKCDYSNSIHLPFTDQIVIQVFDKKIQDDYRTPLANMSDFINSFMYTVTNSDENVWLAKALLDLVENDQSIEAEQVFYVQQSGLPLPKSKLISLSDIFLPSFLLGIWHFIVVNRTDNSIGKETFNNWHTESESKHGMRKFTGIIGLNLDRQINVLLTEDTMSGIITDDVASEINDNPELLQTEEAPASDEFQISNSEIDEQEFEKCMNSPPSEQMLEIFKQAILDCSIVKFMASDPTCYLLQDLLFEVDNFFKVIGDNIKQAFIHHQKDLMYQKINEFTHALDEYIGYLGPNMRPSLGSTDIFVPLHREENIRFEFDFAEKSWNYRQTINAVYGEICDGNTLFV